MTRGNFKKKIDEIFWDSYAKVYDDMDKYYKSYKSLIDEIANFIDDNIKRKDRVLDAGCGTGTLSIKLIEKGFPVNAIDISETMLAVFKKKIKDKNTKNLEIKNGDLNK